MEFRGKLLKTEDRPPWVVESPSLGVITQGNTKKEAIAMLKDAIEVLIESYFKKKVKVKIVDHGNGVLGIVCKDNKILISLSLVKQREKSGLSIRQVAQRLGSNSPNAYARYEKGNINITIDKLDQIVHAVNPRLSGVLVSYR